MKTIENILGNLGKGLATGAAKAIDPFGTGLSYLDKKITGAGYSDERAPKTFHNHIYQQIYSSPEKKLNEKNEYVSRGIGTLLGAGAGLAGTYGLYLIHPVLGLAPLALTGLYGIVNMITKYIQDFPRGEKAEFCDGSASRELYVRTENGKEVEREYYEKASLEQGFYYGWNKYTSFFGLAHDGEACLTGRGRNNSRIESSLKESSKQMRRNYKAVLGSFLGSVVGLALSIASLGIIPIYKTIRDYKKNF